MNYNIIMVIMVNALFIIMMTLFSAWFMQKGIGWSGTTNNPGFQVVERGQARILAMHQTQSYINHSPVFVFTLEIRRSGSSYIITEYREAVRHIALASYRENRVYSVLLGEARRDIFFEKNKSGKPIEIITG